MDEITQAVANLKKEWEEASAQIQDRIRSIEGCGNSGRGTEEAAALPRLNGAARDGLALLRSLQFRLDLLAQQLPTVEESQSALMTLDSWKEEYERFHTGLRNANLQAKTNIRKAAQEERELLLGGGEESTIRRRNLQTKAGMTSAAESITESLRRSRHLMVQEVERTANTLMTFDGSTSVLKNAETEFKGQKSLLSRTRNLLSTMRRQDVIDRVILVVGCLVFMSAVLYVSYKRSGLAKLQRNLYATIKSIPAGYNAVGAAFQRLAPGAGLNKGQPAQLQHLNDEL